LKAQARHFCQGAVLVAQLSFSNKIHARKERKPPKTVRFKSRKKVLTLKLKEIKRSKFSPTQIAGILKEFDNGKSAEEINRVYGISKASLVGQSGCLFYR